MRKRVAYVLTLLFLGWALSACIIAEVPPGGCADNRDCAQGTFCTRSGACVPPQDIACSINADCPEGTDCDAFEGVCFFP